MTIIIAGLNKEVAVGIYEGPTLIHTLKEGATYKTYDALCALLLALRARLDLASIDTIIYSRGPGSLTGNKLIHIAANSLAITLGARLFSVDSFYFTRMDEIYAYGDLCYVRDGACSRVDRTLESNFEIESKMDSMPSNSFGIESKVDLTPSGEVGIKRKVDKVPSKRASARRVPHIALARVDKEALGRIRSASIILPERLDMQDFGSDNRPIYIVPPLS